MSIDPKILKRLQMEDAYLQKQSRQSRRVKIERGQQWLVRFLPAKMGPDGLWFARIARHWMGKLPIICPTHTAEDFGGDPTFDCPVCAVAEQLNDSHDEAINNLGYRARSNPQFLTWCIVWEKDGVQQPINEVLLPYEFWHYRSTFEELKGFYLAGSRKGQGDSILDYMKGNDFVVHRTIKGLRLDKMEAAPIFDPNSEQFEEYIQRIEANIKMPRIIIPTKDELYVFAQKLQAMAEQLEANADSDAMPARRQPIGKMVSSTLTKEDDLPMDDDDDGYIPRQKKRPVQVAQFERTAEEESSPVSKRTSSTNEGPQKKSRAVEEKQTERTVELKAASKPSPLVPRNVKSEVSEEEDSEGSTQAVQEMEDVEEMEVSEPKQKVKLEPTELQQKSKKQPKIITPEDEDNLPADDIDPVPPTGQNEDPDWSVDETEASDEQSVPPPPVKHKGGNVENILARLNKLDRKS